MVGCNINEMNAEWERSKYNENLEYTIHNSNVASIYTFLIQEFKNGNLERNDSIGVLLKSKDLIPLKNQLGEIVDRELFICTEPMGYFSSIMLQRIMVHPECMPFAQFLKYNDLSSIHFENIDYKEILSADDVESLLDDYFVNSEEILRGFYKNGQLSDELITAYDLGYLVVGGQPDPGSEYSFPEDAVENRSSLSSHVDALWNSRRNIITVKEERSVQKVENKQGKDFALDSNEARHDTLQIYTPEGAQKLCFCQMCRKIKWYNLIEVNNIEVKPKFYFPQLRIALCLECSKNYLYLRQNEGIRNAFIETIKNTHILYEKKLDIPIGKQNTITFTAKHLAQIQEILKKMN